MKRPEEAKRKKFFKENTHQPLPIFTKCDGEIEKFIGKFNGFSVTVEDTNQMLKLYLNGFFGKGSLSRSYPHFNNNNANTSIIRKRQHQNRNVWSEKLEESSRRLMTTIVIPDSDCDDEDNYFKNLKPTYHIDKSNLKEVLTLSLEEAYFLSETLKCLDIYFEGKLILSEDAWKLFCDSNKYFMQNYIIYFYYRSKNWIVKTGLKFGGDYCE